MHATEGEVLIGGRSVAREHEAVKDRIGYMAQRFGLYNDLTVDENMEFYAELFGISREHRERLTPELLHMTRMEPFRKRQAGQLSGGMKQKLGLMCTLLHHPEILFLDEPTNGVDPVSRREFWAILYQLVKESVTIFVTTAYLDEAERCNRVGLMHRGKLIRCDSPDVLRSELGGACYEVQAADQRAARFLLETCAGVVSVQPSGSTLHLFLDPARTSPEVLARAVPQAAFKPITPSLEDVFIARMREAENLVEARRG
jgi:ABC-2 type transport system ATP-binding protein